MFLRVNGLFGWIDSNGKRSIALFAGFLVMFHMLGLVALALPLLLQAPDLAPFTGWGGYLRVVMPLLMLLGAAVFGVQYFWQTRIVRSRLKFRYVDAQDEPRLCRIAEPLVIAAGIPVPYLALIDDPAMNAFACGVRRADTVIVVTRGLLDGLDDDQLAAVLAHEIAHIRDGDIKLMAAANVCMSSIGALFMTRRKIEPVQIACSLLGTVFVPPLFVAILAIGLLRQVSFWLAQAVRLGIASSREYIADAVAVRLTHNPAALVSALRVIEGRSALAAAGTFEAMMIDGAAEGEAASHPRIAERIAALVAATGGMALIDVPRRDSRAVAEASPPVAGFGRKGLAALAPARGASPAAAAFTTPRPRSTFALARRIAADSPNNLFGFPRKTNVLLVVWVLLFGVVNHAALADPAKLAGKFDPTALVTLVRQARETTCPMAIDGQRSPAGLQLGSNAECYAVAKRREQQANNAEAARNAWMVARIAENHCFASRSVSASGAPEEGYWPLSRSEEHTSAAMFAGLAIQQVDAFTPGKPASDADLANYVEQRRTGLLLLVDYYGPAGVAYAQAELLGPDHAAVLDRLRTRLADPAYAAALSPINRAEYRLLVDDPAAFVPCKAKLGHNLFPPLDLVSDPPAFGFGAMQ